MKFPVTFKKLTDEDYFQVKEIYDHYVAHSTATFHSEPVSINELKEFIYLDNHRFPSYLVMTDGVVAGFCYLSHFKKREAYLKTAEVTVYLRPEFCGKGIGKKVLQFLEEEAVKIGFKNLLAIITGTNIQSIGLFEKEGYVKCAHFKNLGEKLGQTLDVLGYQKEIGLK